MEIFLTRNGQKLGPFSVQDVNEMLRTGSATHADQAWYAGLKSWIPLHQVPGVTPPLPQAPPVQSLPGPSPTAKRRSKVIAGFAIGCGSLIFLFVFLPALIAAFRGARTGATTGSSAANGAAEASREVYGIGETVRSSKFEIAVTNVEIRQTVGSQYFNSTAAEGGIYLAVQWQFKNISNQPIGAFSQPSLHLLDPTGTKYDPDLGASASFATQLELTSKALSDLNPGISVRNAAVFEVSQALFSQGDWHLLVDADARFKVALPRE